MLKIIYKYIYIGIHILKHTQTNIQFITVGSSLNTHTHTHIYIYIYMDDSQWQTGAAAHFRG